MAEARPRAGPGGTVGVLADDLIWASRLVAAVERAGARPLRLTTIDQLRTALEVDSLLGVVIDLNGRRYDGADAVAIARAAGTPVVCAAEHDDQVTRRRALDAGASRVFAYAKLFSDGPQVIARWLDAIEATGSAA